MGNKINRFRKEKNLTIEVFAEQLGYSISTITKLIYGERKPSRSFFKKLKATYPDADINIFFEE